MGPLCWQLSGLACPAKHGAPQDEWRRWEREWEGGVEGLYEGMGVWVLPISAAEPHRMKEASIPSREEGEGIKNDNRLELKLGTGISSWSQLGAMG